jgi:hypothetical protein
MQATVLHYKATEVRYIAYYRWNCSIVDLYTEIYTLKYTHTHSAL